MTTPKLPEPKHPAGILRNYPFLPDLYTADQVREILEIAAKECDNLAPDPDQWSPKEEYTERRTARACAAAIRTFKEQL